jgi:hypothetical protein
MNSIKSKEFIVHNPDMKWDVVLIAAWTALLASVCIATFNNWNARAFSPDSWAYYELSQTMMTDFYRINHLRSYWSEDYSAAFPPLWPAMIFVANLIFALGPNVAIALNMVILVLIAAVADSIAKKTFDLRGPGILMALALFSHHGFFDELVAGRAIPLFVLLGFVALRILIIKPNEYQILRFGALGCIIAAMLLTRFDGLLWFFVLFPIVIVFKSGLGAVISFFAFFLACVSPWVVYSITHFDTLLVSDNSWVARSLDPNAFVTDFPAALGPTLSQDYSAALKLIAGRVPDLLSAMAISPGERGLFVLTGLLICLWFLKPRRNLSLAPLENRHALSFIVVGVAILSALPSYLLTGYFDGRYFSFLFAFLSFLTTLGIWVLSHEKTWFRIAALTICLAAAAVTIHRDSNRVSLPQIGLSYEGDLFTCLELNPDHAPILVGNATQAARLTALYGVRTAFVPANFLRNAVDPSLHADFLATYNIEYAIDPDGTVAGIFGAEQLQPAKNCGLSVFRFLPAEE